ncbi:MAG: hypothetical protein FJ267_17760, partial [Planctomycetes bacterium]|nr:hypothetical protein [Planctomycetota bacterium]
MTKQRISSEYVLVVQLIVGIVFVASLACGSATKSLSNTSPLKTASRQFESSIPRTTPLTIEPLYDDPEVVSDEELGAVLAKIRPIFPPKKLKPNFVEHALRAWSISATFANPKAMSGQTMKDYLVDHGKYLASWGDSFPPLLQDRDDGVAIRWGKEEGASVHHDHWLACLTEAGIGLHDPVFTPSHRSNVSHVLHEALLDFKLDENEVEWSAMAFGFWIAPHKSWTTRSGREISFDMLAERLMRGHKRFGVCSGTHRIYSLMVLVRLDDDFDILSDESRAKILYHLKSIRDLISVSQFPDGHWPSNWSLGAVAVE